MNEFTIDDQIRELRVCRRNGDTEAAAECERDLASYIRRVVRRITRIGQARSTFEEFVLSEADSVVRSEHNDRNLDRKKLTRLVSNRVFSTLLDRIEREPLYVDRIRNTFRLRKCETVVLSN